MAFTPTLLIILLAKIVVYNEMAFTPTLLIILLANSLTQDSATK